MDDPIMNDNAGQAGGGGEEGVAAAAVGAGADDPIFADLENGTWEAIREVIEARPDVVRATDAANGWTLLHHAVHLGASPDKIRYLLEVGPGAARERARNGGPLPIHLVNPRTDPEVPILLAQQWLEALHLSYEPHEEGNVPFFCAIKNGAPVSVVAAMFLLRYEPAFAAASMHRVFRVAVKVGERELFEAMDTIMLGEHREFSREATAQDGVMALRLALQVDADLRVVRFLAPAWPASIRSRDENGRTFLHLAVLNGVSRTMVQYLASLWEEAVLQTDNQGCFPIHYVRSFTNDPSILDPADMLFMMWPESLQQANDAGEIPLHGAAESNSLPLVQFIVEKYPAGLQHRSNDGLLPIHKAVQAAQPVGEQVVPYLVQQWPDSVLEETNDGRTVLHCAVVGRGGPALVDLLVVDNEWLLRARATDSSLALHYAAAFYQDLATVRRLIDLMHPEAIRSIMRDGRTPLHVVAHHRNGDSAVALARILIERGPPLVRSQTTQGRIPLHCAADEGPLELIEILLGEWPDSISFVDDGGLTPLHWASSRPPGVVRNLADRWPGALSSASNNGWLPLHCAAQHQLLLPSVQALVEREPRALLAPTTDGFRRLPLHLAVVRNDPPLDIVKYLAEESPGSLRVRDATGALPVELAAGRDAPLDFIFVLFRRWPECLLPRRASVAGETTANRLA
jgi:ankyrin repeat protein